MHDPAFFAQQHLETMNIQGDFGIYVHVPFCVRRCRYCAFVSSVCRPVPSHEFASAVCREFCERKSEFDGGHLTTLYFGGGTPTMLLDEDIERIVQTVVSAFNAPLEITLEANPEHITTQRAVFWKTIGVTRISLGTQSFDDEMLTFLGRRHSSKEALEAIDVLKKTGFDEISLDLIYGGRCREGRTDAQEIGRWKRELEIVREIESSHVSCYELTIEEKTPIWVRQNRGDEVVCSDDAIADMMEMIPDELGMFRYEISNYSRNCYLSRHNLSCWAGVPYLGLGPGAHSMRRVKNGAIRRANSRNIQAWLRQMMDENGEMPAPEFVEDLDGVTHFLERIMCASRTKFLWSPDIIAEDLDVPSAFLQAFCSRNLKKAREMGLICRENDDYRTTNEGIRLNNRLDVVIFEQV